MTPVGCLGKPHAALIPANSVPRSPAKSGRACSQYPLRTDGRNQTRRPNRERRHDCLKSCRLIHPRHRLAVSRSPLMARRTVPPRLRRRTEACKSAFQREQTAAHFWRPSPGLPVPLEAGPVSVRVLGRSLATPVQDSLPHLCRPDGTSDFFAPFSGSKTRRDSTFPQKIAYSIGPKLYCICARPRERQKGHRLQFAPQPFFKIAFLCT